MNKEFKYIMTFNNSGFKTIYKQCSEEELLKHKDKEGFKAFAWKHKPTQIATVSIINDTIIINKFNK